MTFATIEEALAEIAAGKMIIVVDDEERENEGDFITAAETVTPEQVNFIAREAGIQLCVGLTRERFEQLSIPMMVADNTAPHQTAFGVSVDLKVPQHTGSSAFDRAAAIRALAHPDTRPNDLVRPGHVFPLRAVDGGVLRRSGHTEAAVDLARLAGLQPAGVLAEIVHPDGTMARVPYLLEVALRHGFNLTEATRVRELNRQTLNYYFDYLGHEVAYRETPQGPDVLAVGDEEILALTKDMSLEEQLKLRRWLP